MLQFIIICIILDILMKIRLEPGAEPVPEKPKAYVMNNTAEYEFKSLDDAMEYREMRLSGWKGNAVDFYKLKGEE